MIPTPNLARKLASQRHCEERSDVAIHRNNKNWIASPSVRNDGGSMYKLSAVIDFGSAEAEVQKQIILNVLSGN
ncbi:MAG: hypothetical protein RLZZ59_486 [Pseudomonadota bacterium]|jgi:hypothetical protein